MVNAFQFGAFQVPPAFQMDTTSGGGGGVPDDHHGRPFKKERRKIMKMMLPVQRTFRS